METLLASRQTTRRGEKIEKPSIVHRPPSETEARRNLMVFPRNYTVISISHAFPSVSV